MSTIRARLKLPREHGAWGMLYVPFLVGVIVAGDASWAVLLLWLSITSLFIARESLVVWWRGRSRGSDVGAVRRLMMGYLGLTLIFGTPLLYPLQFYLLIPMAGLALILLAVNAQQVVRREGHTILGEVLAVVGLTASAPAAYYVARGMWEDTALWLWALSALYFTSSVLYIKLRVFSAQPRKELPRRQLRRRCAFYHSFLLGGLLVVVLTGSLNLLALIAFAPVLARTAWALLTPASQLNLRRVGILEFLYAFIFLVFITLTFHPR